MAGYNTPKEMQHPSGSKVLFAYSTEDEQRINAEFVHFRAENAEAHNAAIEGRDIRPVKTTPHKGA